MSRTFYFLLAILLLAGVLVWQGMSDQDAGKEIASFDDCVAAGFPVAESYPEQCRDDEGKVFVRPIGNELAKADLIRLATPRPGGVVSSPLEIRGEARGTWFFEASFPARIFDAAGRELGVVPITAQGEWMTEEFVPFFGTLTFSHPETATGTLILEKDNPSGLPEFADQLELPVNFSDRE